MPASNAQEDSLIQIGEWTTDDQEEFDLYMGSDAPRRFSVWRQIAVDLSSLKGARLIAPGMLAALIGLVKHWWWLALVGAALLYRYYYMLFVVVRGRRLSKIYVGVVRDISTRHPMYPSEILAQAECAEGRLVPVVVSEQLAAPIYKAHGSLRAAIAYDGLQEYGRAIAVSPPTNGGAHEA